VGFEVRNDGKIRSKAIYTILAINKEGKKDLLGLYLSESEGANLVLTDLQNRGLEDILIACIDNLNGFSEAIESTFPNTEVQSCVIHQIRNSLKYVASKNQKEFMKYLKLVYKADTKELAELNLDKLEKKWGEKYPIVIKSCTHCVEIIGINYPLILSIQPISEN
jgi:putative transposase